ncbi:MAG: hypothetical protein Q7T18_02415 [Sedimentisphaerales bacterium]|nr:hypothetical protein [Sedimentisphaerales bacterium]
MMIAAIAMGFVFAVCGYRWGFYTMWAVLFNLTISIYLGVMLSPTAAGVLPMLFPADAQQSSGAFWYIYAGLTAGVSLVSFIILQTVAMSYFTGTFNITLPKLLENLGAAFAGFVTGYVLWGFICFLVLIMPVSQSVFLKSFTADRGSIEVSMPTVSKVVNIINAVSLQPNRRQVQNIMRWTLDVPDTSDPNEKKVSVPSLVRRRPQRQHRESGFIASKY